MFQRLDRDSLRIINVQGRQTLQAAGMVTVS
jgi:hypothetical protein